MNYHLSTLTQPQVITSTLHKPLPVKQPTYQSSVHEQSLPHQHQNWMPGQYSDLCQTDLLFKPMEQARPLGRIIETGEGSTDKVMPYYYSLGFFLSDGLDSQTCAYFSLFCINMVGEWLNPSRLMKLFSLLNKNLLCFMVNEF